MERISGDGFFSYRREVGDKAKETRKSGKSRKARSFSSELRSAETEGAGPVERLPEAVEAETAELLDAVFQAGDRLKHQTDRETLESYKTAIRDFISAVVDRGLGVSEHMSGSHILKRKRYALVQVVDKKLEQLAVGMLANQKSQIDLLARIDEINGMIVDLTR